MRRHRNPCATKCLAFQPTCFNVCCACQLPSVFDLLLATILWKRAESLVTCRGTGSVCPRQGFILSLWVCDLLSPRMLCTSSLWLGSKRTSCLPSFGVGKPILQAVASNCRLGVSCSLSPLTVVLAVVLLLGSLAHSQAIWPDPCCYTTLRKCIEEVCL